jgi:hypothetical protein
MFSLFNFLSFSLGTTGLTGDAAIKTGAQDAVELAGKNEADALGNCPHWAYLLTDAKKGEKPRY